MSCAILRPALQSRRRWNGEDVLFPFGSNILFRCANIPELVVAAEICEDLWVMDPPSISHAMAGATVIVNCSASNETTGKAGIPHRPDQGTVGQTALRLCVCQRGRGRIDPGSGISRGII